MEHKLLNWYKPSVIFWYGNAGAGVKDESGGQGQSDQTPPPDKTYTKAELDSFLERERQKTNKELTEQFNSKINELTKTLKANSKEKSDIEKAFKELQQKNMSAEELAKIKADEAREQAAIELEEYKKSANDWETRFKSSTLERSIREAAIAGEAINPKHIYALIKDKAKLVEETDKDGKSTGIYNTVITMDVKGKIVDVPIEEAIKSMREQTDEYGNLFKGTGQSGFGTSKPGGKVPFDYSNMDTYRKQIREQSKR